MSGHWVAVRRAGVATASLGEMAQVLIALVSDDGTQRPVMTFNILNNPDYRAAKAEREATRRAAG